MIYTVSRLMFPDAPAGNENGICSICGTSDDGQYLRNELLDKTSANLTSIFNMLSPVICRYCVAVWREPKKYHRAVYADPAGVLFPVISRDSVTEDRPLWADVIRAMPANEYRVIILTTDPKKRTWPLARVSRGDRCTIFLHDPSRGISGNVQLSLDRWRETLAVIESAYDVGFAKPAIATSLYTSHKIATVVGIDRTRQMEQTLAGLRSLPEFSPALIIAQKGSDESA